MEIREIKEKTCLINDFNAIKTISISKVNEAWANSSPIDGKQCLELKYIKVEGNDLIHNMEIREIEGKNMFNL